MGRLVYVLLVMECILKWYSKDALDFAMLIDVLNKVEKIQN